MDIEEILGDYNGFFARVIEDLKGLGIDAVGLPISHFGYKCKSVEEYELTRDALVARSDSMIENVHNGRPIAKIILSGPLMLGNGFEVSLIELMPPKNAPARINGLEHCGFVVGETLDEFIVSYKNVITEIQDQGPYCQPASVVFEDGLRAKFYKYSLKQVVELESQTFIPIHG